MSWHLWHLWHRWLGLACLCVLSCSASGGGSPPQLTPIGTVGPSPGPEAGPLSVVYAGPRGAAALDSSINVLLSKPLRALDGAEATVPALRLIPEVAGSWQWVGSRALTFVPRRGRLPAATAYAVSVPAGIAALDGDTLAQTYDFEFHTPAPAILSSEPELGAQGERPDIQIVLKFNQPVKPGALEKAARLDAVRGKERTRLAFRAQARANAPDELVVVPRAPLPLASTIELSLAQGLVGSEGSDGLEVPYSLSFETYGPLRVMGANCHVVHETGRCDPDGAIWVELSNPVKVPEFSKHLSLEPPIDLAWSDDDDQESRYIYLPRRTSLAAATAYRISVSAGLTDRYGQKLAQKHERVLNTGNFSARVSLPITGEVFAAPFDEVSLRTRNAADVRVYVKPLAGEQLLDYYKLWDDYEQRQTIGDRLKATLSRLPSLVDNQFHNHPIALGPILGGAGARGAAWIGWRHAGGSDGQLVQVTDLALTAKLSAQGSLVWVTRLSNGAPVAGATVQLLGRSPEIAKRYQTDAAGLVSIPAGDYRPRLSDYSSEDDTLLLVSHERDTSFRRVADFMRPWRVEVPMRLAVPEREYGLLFSERGIYRPGDLVKVKGILRRESTGGNSMVAARRLDLLLRDPYGEIAGKQAVETTRFGTFAADVQLPGGASLGSWRLEADGFADNPLAIEIAEYRAAEFKVAVAESSAEYLRKDAARFSVSADYLFGSPLAGAKLSYAATRERTSFSPPNSGGYSTAEDAYREGLEHAPLDSNALSRGEGKLSPAGTFELKLPLELPGQTGPERLRVDVEVSDVSRQAIGASAGALVHPASYYVGIAQFDSWFQTAPSAVEPRVLAFSPQGKRVAGRSVKLELLRRRWTVAREKTSDGWRTLSTPVDEPRGSCEVVTANEPVSCPLQLTEGGQWFVRASSSDSAGRVARSALGFYAIGGGRVSWADNDQHKLELVLDKSQYRVGDTARLLIKSPFERAEALLTIERAGVYEHRRITLQGPTPTVEIPIDERLRPNAFVAVHLVQGVAANAPPTPLELTPEPGYRMGYAPIIVDPAARRLTVEIQGLAKEYRPRQKVSADFRVSRAGRTAQLAELTVYAVDEGVLSLIGYQAPDPVSRFTEPRPLAVATLESRDSLGRRLLPGPESDKGADGGGGGASGSRSDFKTTAYFNPNVLTDAEGRAHVEFELPDNLTTFRLMAVAVSEDDRYGVGNAALVVNQPLMVRPALPRSLRAGDRFQASAILSSRHFDPGNVQVRASVSGAVLHGPAEKQLLLGKDASVEVRFEVEVTEPGEASFEFAASAANERDEVKLLRRVVSPTSLETTAVYGRTDQKEAQALGQLSGLRRDVGGLELSLAPSALVGLDVGLNQLAQYPYECTEQLASRALPLGPLSGLAERYGLAVPLNPLGQLELQVGEILRRQHHDGGFRLWPDSQLSHPWTSGYALWVLWQAKRAGARVPERVFEQGAAYLRQQLANAAPERQALAAHALFVDVLGALGKFDREYESRLFARRQELPVFARALLLHAAASGPPDGGNAGVLSRELESLISLRGNKAEVQSGDETGFESAFDSKARTEALVLWALLASNPKHPFGAPLAQGVLERRALGTWRNTQETAYALLALDAYRQAQEPEVPHFDAAVWLGDTKLLSGAFNGPSAALLRHRVAMPELAKGNGRLVFEKQGPGTLFYEARLTYAPEALPSLPLERGFGLTKSVRVVRPEELERALAERPPAAEGVPSLRGGDLVLVDLVIAAPADRFFVVVDDPLPAGLEAVDSRLATTSADLDLGRRALVEPQSGFQDSWFRQEVRDDRVLFFADEMRAGLHHYRYLARATALGRFVVPPTRVQEMYQPEVFARSAAGQVEVR